MDLGPTVGCGKLSGMSRTPGIELLWWRECPSWERALAELREEATAVGLDPDAIEVVEIDTEEAAASRSFVGSPTIRIDGKDIQPVGDNPVGLACRVYRRSDGRVSPLPDRAELRRVLAAAANARI
jgi:hypothetical protein